MSDEVKVLLALTFCLAVIGPARAAEWDRYAVLVGSNHGDDARPDLRYAERDAKRMAALLQELGGFDEERIRLLTGKKSRSLPAVLKEIDRKIGAQKPGRSSLLVLYYSGHATAKALELDGQLFPLKKLKKYLKTSRATVRVAFVDACHSGALVRYKGGRRVEAFPLDLEGSLEATGYAVLTSSAASERSQESEELKGSFFTHFLVSGLRGAADASSDGKVTLDELYRFTYKRTLDRSLQAGANAQHPTFDFGMRGRGELVLSRLSRARARISFSPETAGNYLVYSNDTDQVVGEVEKVAGESRMLAVPPGSLEVFRREDRRLLRKRIHLEEGGLVTIDDSGLKEIARSYLLDKGAGPRFLLSAGGGYQFFWDSGIRQTSLLPSYLASLQLRLARLLGPVDLSLRLSFGGGTGSLSGGGGASLAQEFSQVQAAPGLLVHLLRSRLRLAIGAEAGLLWVRRTTHDGELGRTWSDTYMSVAPAGSLMAGLALSRRLSIEATARAGYYNFKEDGDSRHLGFSELLGALVFLF